MRAWLLDTGPLVAYLSTVDPDHGRVTGRMDDFDGQLVTTSSVITEAMYFVSASPRGPRLLADLASGLGLHVYDFCEPRRLGQAVALMEQYADTPMDFADATLLLLADHLELEEIVTLDQRGFSAFRTVTGRALRQVLLID